MAARPMFGCNCQDSEKLWAVKEHLLQISVLQNETIESPQLC